eukprot:425571_1
MSARSKKYFQAFKELQMIERKYDIFPEYERRCKERNTFMDRNAVNKACSETFTLIAIKEIAKYEKEYTICSSTGNIYYVRIGTLNYCTCYQYSNKTIQCKHILFVLIKVIKINLKSPILYQNGLMLSELDKIFQIDSILIVHNETDKNIVDKYYELIKNKENDLYIKRKAIQHHILIWWIIKVVWLLMQMDLLFVGVGNH